MKNKLARPHGASPRHAAWSILVRYEKAVRDSEERRADALIDVAIRQAPPSWPASAGGWLTHQVMTVLRHWHPTSRWIATLTGRKLKDTPPAIRTVLRLGLNQLAWSPDVPAAVIVDETVDLLRQTGGSDGQIRLVNALLRRVADLPIAERQTALTAGSPWPAWLLARWSPLLTPEALTLQQQLTQTQPPFGVRVNTMKTTVLTYAETLTHAGIEWIQPLPEEVPEALVLPGWQGGVRHLPGFADGAVTVQDVASSLVSRWLDPQPHEWIADLCAAPGSKTCHLADLMLAQSSNPTTGRILAVDVSASRLERVKENVVRLSLPDGLVEPVICDGAIWLPADGLPLDVVLVDAPCSGLGTLRRHPEKLVDFREADLEKQRALQVTLLHHALSLVKPGGRVIYSVCSVDPVEGDEVVAKVLAEQSGWQLAASQTLWPSTTQDGFYIARLTKLI